MFTPYYFTDENIKSGFKNNLDSHNVNLANSDLPIARNFPEFGIEFRHTNNISKEMVTIYARFFNQYYFKYHTSFSESFYKIKEEDQINKDT